MSRAPAAAWPSTLANLAAHVEGRELVPRDDFGPTRRPEIRVELTSRPRRELPGDPDDAPTEA